MEIKMHVTIFKTSKTAMQSGNAKRNNWVLEFLDHDLKDIEPLMGWTSSSNTRSQVVLNFSSKEDAISYCEKKGYTYNILETKKRKKNIRKNGYGDNFLPSRKFSWTH